MSKKLTVTYTAPLENYSDIEAFENNFKKAYEEIHNVINSALLSGDLLSITSEYTQDITHYIARFYHDWIDQATYDEYVSKERIQYEKNTMELKFDINRE